MAAESCSSRRRRRYVSVGPVTRERRGVPPDLRGAIDLYVRAAQAELPAAQHALCKLLLDGRGVAQNFQDAAGWCLAAAHQHHAPAQLLLATFYALGRGFELNEARAAAWLSIAAEQRYHPALKARDALLASSPSNVQAHAKDIAKKLCAAISIR